MKDLIRKILKESEEDEFAWVPEGDLPLGKDFDESDVCFGIDDECVINITNDEIRVKLDLEDWVKKYVNGYDEGYYFLRSLLYQYNYDDSYDLDDDEFNYVLFHLDDDNKRKLNEIIEILGIGGDVEDYRDQMYKLFDKFDEIKSSNRMIDYILTDMSQAIADGRQSNMEEAFNDIVKKIPFSVDARSRRSYRDSNDEVYITLPVDYAFDMMADGSDLTQVLRKISREFDLNWDDIYYSNFDTSSATDDINRHMDEYLSDLMEELETNESVTDYRDFNKSLKNLGFQNTSNGIWAKTVTPKNSDNTYRMQIKNISIEDKHFVLNLIKYDLNGNFIKTTEHRLPFDKLGDFVQNYQLDLY